MKLKIEDLLNISFTFRNLTKLYLYTNLINERDKISSSLLEEKFEDYFKKLEYFCVDNNKINSISKLLKMLYAKSIQFLNVNQNNIEDIYEDDDDFEIIKSLEKNIKGLYLDFNLITNVKVLRKLDNFKNIIDLNLIQNPVFSKIGIEKSKILIVGRLPKLENLNNTFINKQARRDCEISYLKYCVDDYFKSFNLRPQDFNNEKFEKFISENHQQFFILKKKYYDPIEEILEIKMNAKTNNIKSNSVEIKIQSSEREIVKKFPKNLSLSNLKNVILKLLKINYDFQFILISRDEENFISDESKTLEYLEVVDGDILKIKVI